MKFSKISTFLFILFVSVCSVISAQPLVIEQMTIGGLAEVSRANLSNRDPMTGGSGSFYFASPFFTALVAGLFDQERLKIGNLYLNDHWNTNFAVGIGHPTTIFVNGWAEYGGGFRIGEDPEGLAMNLMYRAYFNTAGPGHIRPVLGLGFMNATFRVTDSFREFSYSFGDADVFQTVGIRSQKVTNVMLKDSQGSKGKYIGVFLGWFF